MAGRGRWRGCSEVSTPERHPQSRLTCIKGRTGSGLRVVVAGDVLGCELKSCSCVCKEQQPQIKVYDEKHGDVVRSAVDFFQCYMLDS